jgi:hypothetical protein
LGHAYLNVEAQNNIRSIIMGEEVNADFEKEVLSLMFDSLESFKNILKSKFFESHALGDKTDSSWFAKEDVQYKTLSFSPPEDLPYTVSPRTFIKQAVQDLWPEKFFGRIFLFMKTAILQMERGW